MLLPTRLLKRRTDFRTFRNTGGLARRSATLELGTIFWRNRMQIAFRPNRAISSPSQGPSALEFSSTKVFMRPEGPNIPGL